MGELPLINSISIDTIIIVAYFVIIVLFGSFFGRFIKGTKDFFFAGQKLSWWLIGMSCVATTVGSYSFIKYSEAAYKYGFSSSMSYLNDWFWMPLWMFGWLPIIYFSRVASIPEYFERRFSRNTRALATGILLLYLTGYIRINIYTLGVAAHSLFPQIDIYSASIIIAILAAIYVTYGGQTAVIMTDLLQGILLLIAGFVLLFLGLKFLAPHGGLLANLSPSFKTAFSGFNKPEEFHFVGIFWQDGMANTAAFYFMNQGLILRFLSAKSVHDGRKAFIFVVLILMPLAAIAVANVGWIGKAMSNAGLFINSEGEPFQPGSKEIFVIVSRMLCKPGLFGIIIAALTAALMSTIDTLINAVSVISVNDIYKPYIKADAPDSHYLKVARIVSVAAALIGILLVPIYASFKTIYAAHAAFTAIITPPLVTAILLGAFWRLYNTIAAISTLLGGSILIFLSLILPQLIQPFAHGVSDAGNYKYMRAFFGLFASGAIGVIVALLTKPQPESVLKGLVYTSINDAIRKFKGGIPNETPGKKVRLKPQYIDSINEDSVRISQDVMQQLNALPDDLLYIADPAWWYGGLRAANVRAGVPHSQDNSIILISKETMQRGSLKLERDVTIVKIM
ncbi:sodium/solute symporter [candidate division KSB1 bacterium]|nr:sodium/solute symporter [candidate division KSB1 bacterium]